MERLCRMIGASGYMERSVSLSDGTASPAHSRTTEEMQHQGQGGTGTRRRWAWRRRRRWRQGRDGLLGFRIAASLMTTFLLLVLLATNSHCQAVPLHGLHIRTSSSSSSSRTTPRRRPAGGAAATTAGGAGADGHRSTQQAQAQAQLPQALQPTTFKATNPTVLLQEQHQMLQQTRTKPERISEATERCPNDCSGHGYCLSALAAAPGPTLAASRSSGGVVSGDDGQDDATPTPAAAGAVCLCRENFAGTDCSRAVCPEQCSSHGTCNPEDGLCHCDPGYVGVSCASVGCTQGCGANGVCRLTAISSGEDKEAIHGQPVVTALCICANGYTGEACQVAPDGSNGHNGPAASGTSSNLGDDCSTLDFCSGHGECIALNLEYTCLCEEGFTGDTCAQRVCPGACSGNGICNTHTGQCACHEPYTASPDCSRVACPGACSQHGVCNTTTGACLCDKGFFGPDCAPDNCEDPTCSGHGMCLHGKCNCTEPGYSGSRCEQRQCAAEWTGTDCSQRRCPYDCSGHGSCDTASYVCNCVEGWIGPACHLRACPGDCNHQGVCVNGTCKCENEWGGPGCTIPPQHCPGGESCSGHGECHHGTCYCLPGFHGADCSQEREEEGSGAGVTPPQPYTDDEPQEGVVCVPPCGPHGKCGNVAALHDGANGRGAADLVRFRATYGFGKNLVCFCESGWAGASCEDNVT